MEKVKAILKGGSKRFGVVFPRKLEVLAMLKGGAKSFQPVKGGRKGATNFGDFVDPFST